MLKTFDETENQSNNQINQNTTGLDNTNALPPIQQYRPNFNISPDMSTGYQFGTSMNVSPLISPEAELNSDTF